MFEKFTERARRVMVLAQEEAKLLHHNFVGTEHLLLGLIHEGEGVAAKALTLLECDLDSIRSYIEEQYKLAPSDTDTQSLKVGAYPFTPRAKKVMELALREALQLGHNYIGTEHLLLGLIRDGEGLGAKALISQGATLAYARQTVIQLLSGYSSAKMTSALEMNKDVAFQILIKLIKDVGPRLPASFLLYLDKDEKELFLSLLSRFDPTHRSGSRFTDQIQTQGGSGGGWTHTSG